MKIQPVVATPDTREQIVSLLREIGVREKRWPEHEVDNMLQEESATLIGVFDEDKCVGATQLTYQHPFPCESGPFGFTVPQDGRIACEVTLIGVDRAYRRQSGDFGTGALDALVKGLYRHHLTGGGTHIYSLCEDWTFNVLTAGYVGIVGRKVTEGHHYWCGTAVCPGPDCQLTYVCELDMRASEHNWATNRPEFWDYLND